MVRKDNSLRSASKQDTGSLTFELVSGRHWGEGLVVAEAVDMLVVLVLHATIG